MKIVVIGCTGLIGSKTVAILRQSAKKKVATVAALHDRVSCVRRCPPCPESAGIFTTALMNLIR
jgi:1-deoxy-D-xylulose 5-phosphate reductoisomerase